MEHGHIAVHQSPFAMAGLALRLEEIGSRERCDEARHGKADQHGDHDREAEALEVLTDYAAHHADRQEHRDD